MSDPGTQEIKALAKLDGNPVKVQGNRVYDASSLVPATVFFTRNQYLFLANFRLGVSLEEAAAKADMTPAEAEHFLERPKTVAWLQDRATKDHLRNEWAEGGKWWQMGDDCLEGKRKLSKDQQVVFMAFGERVCPKPRVSDEGKNTTVINFNFSAQDVKEAFAREASFETDVFSGNPGQQAA